MTKTTKIISLVGLAAVLCFSFATSALAQNTPQIQTNSAINVQNNSATLQANLTYLGNYNSATVYFQWGTSTAYGSQTPSQTQNYTGTFNQLISGLTPNTTYHFMAVAQNSYGTVYGQDMTFYTSGYNGQQLTANAGPDLYISSGQTATLQGSGYDPNGYQLTYYWTCSAGSLSSNNVAQPTYTAPYLTGYGTQTSYICTLTVNNGYGNSSSDSMNIYLSYNNNNYNGSGNVQTDSATNVSNYQATLNGHIPATSSYSYYLNYVYFQWGTTTNYGSQTNQQSASSPGTFSQTITNISPNTFYHFRAVLQTNYGTFYGQDMTFYSSNSGSIYNGNGTLSVSKQVIDLTSGNLNWSASVNANTSDILSFAITLQAYNQDVHNVIVRDILPANLTYRGNVIINTGLNYSGDITSGINVGTVYANQPTVVAYQVQVAPVGSFNYGATTLTNSATITSQEAGSQNASATITVNRTLVYGATTVSTGITNNFLTDSFFLPLLLIIAGLWLYFSGGAHKLADKIRARVHPVK